MGEGIKAFQMFALWLEKDPVYKSQRHVPVQDFCLDSQDLQEAKLNGQLCIDIA